VGTGREKVRASGGRPSAPKSDRGITRRSVLLGFCLAGVLCALTPYNDYVVGNTFLAGNHFPVGAVAVLLLLSTLNLVTRRLRGSSFLSAPELAVIYIVIMVTSGIPSSGLLRYLIPTLPTPYYFAGVGNRWEGLIWDHIPHWLGVSGAPANWFFEGLPERTPLPWGVWWTPLSRWLILVGAIWLMMICLSALVRKQWADRERLAFPLVQFPLDVLRDTGRGPSAWFFGNRLVWLGATLVLLVHVINGLHVYQPMVPGIPTSASMDAVLVDRPWAAAVPVQFNIYFSVIGFGYLLSSEVAAGFWFSILLMKVQAIILSQAGYEGTSAWSGAIAQIGDWEQMGALLMVAGMLLWFLRGTLASAFRQILSPSASTDDGDEPLSYRFAALGLMAGLGISFAWLVSAGMTPLFAALFLVFFVAICLVLTRIIAEAGLLMVQFSFRPVDYLLLFGGTTALGPANLTVLTFVDTVLTFDVRESLMPSVLNGTRMAEQADVSTRKLSKVIGAALVIALVVTIPVFLVTFHKLGAIIVDRNGLLTSLPDGFFVELASRLDAPSRPSGVGYLWVLVGAAAVAVTSWLRLTYVWWPVHPLGLVMGTSYATRYLWFSLFLGWVFRTLTVRYSGLRGYVRFRPVFMGIIMGDVFGAVLWNIVGLVTKVGIMVTLD
jgi:hypothetical protein